MVIKSEKRESAPSTHEKIRVWNCPIERSAIELCRAAMPVSTACYLSVSHPPGIYCRPICPARTPKFENCRFFGSAAAAQEAGFRPCLRCRPETAPDLASWRGTSNTVSRALALITDGALDGDGASVETLAERLGRRRTPTPAIVPSASWSLAHRGGTNSACALCQTAHSRNANAHDRSCASSRIRQCPAIQRDISGSLSSSSQRIATKKLRESDGWRRRV